MRRISALIGMLISIFLLATCTPEFSAPAPQLAPTATTSTALVTETDIPAGASPAGSNDTASETVTITFAAAKEEHPLFEPLITNFQTDNPGIRVQLVDINQAATTITLANGDVMTAIGPESLRTVLSLADTATGIGPTPEAIAHGWLRDLAPLIDADPTFDRADFYPHTLVAEPNGQIYMLPAKQYVDLLGYNKALWASRGLPSPQPSWTWNDLKAAAQQLARKRGTTVEIYGMVDWEPGLPALRAELAEAGYQPDPSAPLRLDDPTIVAALERVVALAQSGAYHGGGDFRQQILNQQVGIWPATPNMLADVYSTAPAEPSFATGILPRPGGSSSLLGYLMSAGTQHPNEAWRWLSFLSRQVVAEPYANANPAGTIPARRSVAEQSGYWKRLDAETTTTIKAVLDGRVPAPSLPEFGLYAEAPLRAALEAALAGKLAPAKALRQAQVELEQQLAKVTPAPSPATNQIVVAAPAPAAADSAVTITFGAPGATSPIDTIAQAFNQHHTDVFVQVKYLDLNAGRPASIAELANKTDCFAAATPPTERESALLLDLRPLLDADPSFSLDDYPSVVLEQFQRDTRVMGLPDGLEFRVLNYNQAAFDAIGLAPPTAAWTLEDLAHAARRLSRGAGSNAQYGFASTFLQWRDIFFVLERFGVSATVGAGANVQPNFTDPQVVQAISFYLDLLRTASPHERLGGYRRGDVSDSTVTTLVRAGRVGMWFDFGSTVRPIATDHSFLHTIAPPPLGQGQPTSNDVRASGLYISATTQHPDACWIWLKVLTSEISHLQSAIPARISLAGSAAFLSQAAPGTAEVYQAYRAALQRPSTGAAQIAAQSAVDYYWFFQAIDRALQGNNLERELANARSLTTQFLECVRGGAHGSTCATQVDPTYQGWRYATPGSP
jgi:ABC-type glycerol-3-phosphate transport system substrate-binding protein